MIHPIIIGLDVRWIAHGRRPFVCAQLVGILAVVARGLQADGVSAVTVAVVVRYDVAVRGVQTDAVVLVAAAVVMGDGVLTARAGQGNAVVGISVEGIVGDGVVT